MYPSKPESEEDEGADEFEDGRLDVSLDVCEGSTGKRRHVLRGLSGVGGGGRR